MERPKVDGRIDLDKPRWLQDTYIGRAKHFFSVTNPKNALLTSSQLDGAKELLQLYRSKKEPPGTTDEQIWEAKRMYDSAFHPETMEKMNVIGRMSFQVPGNMTICGCMMTFYKSTPAVIFWQWVNQSFNATVNYTNRSGSSNLPTSLLATSYIAATSSAVAVAVGLNKATTRLPTLVGRFVPFVAVAAANCVNIPLMRKNELLEGIDVVDKDGNVIGKSQAAARSAIVQVVLSRIFMATPCLVLTPIFMNFLENRTSIFKKGRGWLNAPISVLFVGGILTFATPMACALFEQQSSIAITSLKRDLQDTAKDMGIDGKYVFFNKGL